MSDPVPTNRPLGGADQTQGVGAAHGSSGAKRTDESGGPEFQALLDKIEEGARDLAQQSRAVEKPEELAGAVDSARESLENVLSLKEQLLEAYEQAKRQDRAPEEPQ
jgi:hypothetical protein